MDVIYKCRCMAEEATVWVPDRKDGQDLIDWVERTLGRALAADHHDRSPLCDATEVDYAKIPMPDGSPMIGQRPPAAR